MRSIARYFVVACVGATVWGVPARGGGVHRRPLGTVVQADRAHLGGATALAGADVYACDPLDTDDGGVLRVQVGSSQIYLTGLSAAMLEDESNETRVLVIRGTTTFSSPASAHFALETPAGVVRADGDQSVAGEVTVTGPHEIFISAVRGSLLLDTLGEFRSIPEGKSARLEFGSSLEVACSEKGGADEPQEVRTAYARPKIAFDIVATAAVALPSYFIWREMAESKSEP
jgi:hypothetical protein